MSSFGQAKTIIFSCKYLELKGFLKWCKTLKHSVLSVTLLKQLSLSIWKRPRRFMPPFIGSSKKIHVELIFNVTVSGSQKVH